MNSARFDESNLRPTYMSQAEANEVMELWAERQREEAARHSLITVHDVAEATQLSTQDVERLLQEVRSSRPVAASVPTRPAAFHLQSGTPEDEPTLLAAYWRIAPYSGVLAFVFVMFLSSEMRYGYQAAPVMVLLRFLMLYALGIGTITIGKYLKKQWIARDRALVARQASQSFRLFR